MSAIPSSALGARGRTCRGPLFALLILTWPAMGHAAKTDLLVLRNGDRITGQVKGLSRGKLDFSTDDAGRLAIEWVKVARVTSSGQFDLEMTSGARYLGRILAADRDGALTIEGSPGDTLEIQSVVRISELAASFLRRVKAYLDVGFTFAKANSAKTITASGEAAYRGPKIGTTLSFDSYVQGQETVPTSTRNTAGLEVTRFLPKRWSALALASLEQNDQLNLAFRFTGGGRMNRVLFQSNKSELVAGGGLVGTREQFSPNAADATVSKEIKTNLEALFTTTWDAFRFDSPTLDFSTTLNLYPGLSTLGRVRGEINTRLKYELFPDFNIGVKVTDTFDNRPPDASASKNDYITSLTIGWSYRR